MSRNMSYVAALTIIYYEAVPLITINSIYSISNVQDLRELFLIKVRTIIHWAYFEEICDEM